MYSLSRRCLSLMHSFSVTSANIAIKSYIAKRFELYFSCRHKRSIFNNLDVIDPNATEFGDVTQNNGFYVVQGYSRSPILVPMESPYATSY